MYGIYINCKHAPFILWILALAKTYETRSRNVFSGLIGQRVALIETGTGPVPVVRGFATITGAQVGGGSASLEDRMLRARSLISGTPYDVQPGRPKWFYRLEDVTACEPFPAPADRENHGRSWTRWRT